MTARTMAEKVWDDHAIGDDLLFIDLHLVHEVSSPQAFDGLREAGRRVRRVDRTLATADHNVPTWELLAARLGSARASAARRAGGERRGVRDPVLRPRARPAGDRACDRARARADAAGHDDRVRRFAHVDARRVRRAGVRHRHERGRARAGHADAAAEAREVDARRLRRAARARRGGEGSDPRPDRAGDAGGRERLRRGVRGRGDPGALDGRSHDGLEHVDRVGRAGGADRTRRRDVRPFSRAGPECRATSASASSCWSAYRYRCRTRPSTPRCASTPPRWRRRSRGARTPARRCRSRAACPSRRTRASSARSTTWA